MTGGSVKDVIEEQGHGFSVQKSMPLIIQVLEAVRYLHEHTPRRRNLNIERNASYYLYSVQQKFLDTKKIRNFRQYQ